MSDDEDPEVVADLQLRAYTEKSRKGISEAEFAAKIRATAKPNVIGVVPCRNRCGAVVSWTEEAEHTFQTFNRQLARKSEAPLDKTKIMFCPTCTKSGMEQRADGLRGLVEKIAAAIRELKSGCNAERERELLDKLKRAGHPDIAGLEQALREKTTNKYGRRVAKGAL
jgi:hypothetical protein